MDLFKKRFVIGISVTPEVGLEVAQIDFVSQTVLKYGVKPIEYDSSRRDISDLDIFRDTLHDLFMELEIPSGSEIVLNIPTICFNVTDYPAALEEQQIVNAIEEDLLEHPFFKNVDPDISAVKLPNSSIQFNKIAYTAANKQTLIEIALMIKALGCKLIAIDTSVNSTLNAMMYKQRIDVSVDKNWVLMLVDSTCCRIIAMNGRNYVDAYEERITIGQVLDDEENYSIVVSTVNPILKTIPSDYLCIISRTNIISANVLKEKIRYSAPITCYEANSFSQEAFLETSPFIDERAACTISLDVIGAAIYKSFLSYSNAHFNLFNASLGDLYTAEQPLEFKLGDSQIRVTPSLLIGFSILMIILIVIPSFFAFTYCSVQISSLQEDLNGLDMKIAQTNQYLKDNEQVSTELFDEGDEIRFGLYRNKNVYTYYTVVGTEIPQKLWLTYLKLDDHVTIEGQADNLESIYAFFRNIKDYEPESKIKLQKLALASNTNLLQYQQIGAPNENNKNLPTNDLMLTSLNADFYEFIISDDDNIGKSSNSQSNGNGYGIPTLEPINETN